MVSFFSCRSHLLRDGRHARVIPEYNWVLLYCKTYFQSCTDTNLFVLQVAITSCKEAPDAKWMLLSCVMCRQFWTNMVHFVMQVSIVLHLG